MMLAPISPPSKCFAASTTSKRRGRIRASMVSFSTPNVFPDYISVSQCEIAQRSSSSFWPMLRRFARNVKRPRPIEPNMSALVTTGSPSEAGAMEDLGVTRLVAVTVVTMEPTRAGTTEVCSCPLPLEIIPNVRIQNTRAVGAVVDSGITRRGEPTLRSTMPAMMRRRPVARPDLVQPPPRQARPVRQRRSPKLRARHRSPSPHWL